MMERMGFGLSVAPEFWDAVMKWVLHDFEGVDNYKDDIRAPKAIGLAAAWQVHKVSLMTNSKT